jgi:hypothetical protein
MKQLKRVLPVCAALALAAFAARADVHNSSAFHGPKANTGTGQHLYPGRIQD